MVIQHKRIKYFGFFSLVALMVITALTVAPVVIKTDIAEAATGTASTTSITMTSAQENLDLTLSVTDEDGVFAVSKPGEEATFAITTNNYTGYNLSIVANDDIGALVNSTDGSTLSSIDAIMGEGEFDTSDNNGKWGYKPSKYNSVSNMSFIPSPTTMATTLDKTTAANASANNYSISLGARVDYHTTRGTYAGSFRLVAVANPVPYSITFIDNSYDSTVAGMPKTIAGDSDTAEIELPTNIPQRTNYTFAGWCDMTPTVDATTGSSTCPSGGQTYQPSTMSSPSFVGIDQTASSNSIILYALWNAPSVTPTLRIRVNFDGAGVQMVLFVADGHSTQVAEQTDKTYAYVTLDAGVAYTVTAYMKSGSFSKWGNNSGTFSDIYANPTTFTVSADELNTSITAYQVITMQNVISSQCKTWATTAIDERDGQSYKIKKLDDGNCWMMDNLNLGATTLTTDLTSDNTNLFVPITAATFNSWDDTFGSYTTGGFMLVSGLAPDTAKPYGALYNYYTASAGTISGSSNSADATYDICPKGWRLPTGGDSGEFQTLYNNPKYNTLDKMRNYYTGAGFVLAGSFYHSLAPSEQEERGYYWSSTRYNTTEMYSLYMHPDSGSGVFPASSATRDGRGASIRCILK